MKLKEFQKNLDMLKEKYGDDLDVKILGSDYIRADNEDDYGCLEPFFVVLEKTEDPMMENDILGL